MSRYTGRGSSRSVSFKPTFEPINQQSQNSILTDSTASTKDSDYYEIDCDTSVPRIYMESNKSSNSSSLKKNPTHYKPKQNRKNICSISNAPRDDLPSYIEQQINYESKQAKQYSCGTYSPPRERRNQPGNKDYVHGNSYHFRPTERRHSMDQKYLIYSQTNPHNSTTLVEQHTNKSFIGNELPRTDNPQMNKQNISMVMSKNKVSDERMDQKCLIYSQSNPHNSTTSVEQHTNKTLKGKELPRTDNPQMNKKKIIKVMIKNKVSDERKITQKEQLVPRNYSSDIEAKHIEKMKGMSTQMQKDGDFKGAHEALLKVVQLQEISLGRNSADLATSRSQLAATMIKLGYLKEALCQLKEALRILLKVNSEQSNLDLSWTLFHVGVVYAKMGKHKEAIYELERAQKLETKLFGHTLDQTARLLWTLECECDSKKDLK